MPFRSKAQARFMFARHPKIAKRWAKESGKKHPIKGLPNKKSSSKKAKAGRKGGRKSK